MARFKPDMEEHETALRPSMRRAVCEIRALYRRGYRPQTLHLRAADHAAIISDLRGAGFDVARGVVFKGIPVKPVDAH